MLRDLLLVLNILVCLGLIGVVLLQRSEGGALGTGGSPTGLVTARGAGDLLTRTTWVLFPLFLGISLALTLLGGRERSSQAILDRLKHATINPATIDKPVTPPPGAPAPAPAQTSQSAPPALALPPLGAPTPRPHPARAAARQASVPVINAPPPAPNLATPSPLALPPIGAPAPSK